MRGGVCIFIPKDRRYVLYFGRYSEEKGVATLIRACRMTPNVQFVFAGKGAMEEAIESVDNIINVGFIQGERLQELVEQAQFSIYPSEWYENCPFSVMESMSSGTPVIGANVGGIPELLHDCEDGELFSCGCAEELADKIVSLWNDPDRLSRYTRACGEARFESVETYCEKLVQIYRQYDQ